MNQKVEFDKIEEIADRLRKFEEEKKPRYYNISFINRSYKEAQPVGTERQSGEANFRKTMHEILNFKNPDKIFVDEFSQRSNNVKRPVLSITIHIEYSYPAIIQTVKEKKEETPQPRQETPAPKEKETEDVLGKLENMRQDIRMEVAKEFQLIKEQEERERMLTENERLKKENKELQKENDKLYDTNEELFNQVETLQKYVPDNLQIAGVSVTKTLGSILGSATEALVKNIVINKPHKVRAIIGNNAYKQLAGLVIDEPKRQTATELNATEEEEELEELEEVKELTAEEQQKKNIVEAIRDLHNKITPETLGKIQLVYAYILNEDESLNEAKLNKLLHLIAKEHVAEQEQTQKQVEETNLE